MTAQSPPSIAESFTLPVTIHSAYATQKKNDDTYSIPSYASTQSIPSSFSRHTRKPPTFTNITATFFHQSAAGKVKLEPGKTHVLLLSKSSFFECEIQPNNRDSDDDTDSQGGPDSRKCIYLRRSALADLASLRLIHSLEGTRFKNLKQQGRATAHVGKQFSLSLDLTTVRRSADWPDTPSYNRDLELALCTHLVIKDVFSSSSMASANLKAEIQAAIGREQQDEESKV